MSDKVKKTSGKFKTAKTTIIGAILFVFAVIGIISSIIFVTNTTINIVENKKGKQAFANYIAPLVVIDPPTFDSVDKLDSKTVLTAAVWNLLKNEKLSKYSADEYQFITVPKTDIEAYATKLFGGGIEFSHQPLGDAYYSFSYNAQDGTYSIPTVNVYVPYTPKVTKIVRSKDIYTLTVDYISTNDFLKSEKAERKKTRLYVLKKIDKNEYNILAVKDPAVSSDTTAVSSAAASGASSAAAVPAASSAISAPPVSSAPAAQPAGGKNDPASKKVKAPKKAKGKKTAGKNTKSSKKATKKTSAKKK